MKMKNLYINLDIKKALITAVVLYALIFLVASVLLFVFAEPLFGFAVLLVSVLLTFYISQQYYFKGKAVKDPIADGLMLGVALVAVIFVLEIVVMVYGFARAQGWAYFTSWHIVVGYTMTLLTPIAVAYTKK